MKVFVLVGFGNLVGEFLIDFVFGGGGKFVYIVFVLVLLLILFFSNCVFSFECFFILFFIISFLFIVLLFLVNSKMAFF